mmetsp:Transcript_22099/g.65508  ORF Transcript_22099/g.65508 Transcript_22099/m.65508 type:complete len:310 (+) Transcript_22099:1169-2098(+)
MDSPSTLCTGVDMYRLPAAFGFVFALTRALVTAASAAAAAAATSGMDSPSTLCTGVDMYRLPAAHSPLVSSDLSWPSLSSGGETWYPPPAPAASSSSSASLPSSSSSPRKTDSAAASKTSEDLVGRRRTAAQLGSDNDLAGRPPGLADRADRSFTPRHGDETTAEEDAEAAAEASSSPLSEVASAEVAIAVLALRLGSRDRTLETSRSFSCCSLGARTEEESTDGDEYAGVSEAPFPKSIIPWGISGKLGGADDLPWSDPSPWFPPPPPPRGEKDRSLALRHGGRVDEDSVSGCRGGAPTSSCGRGDSR